MAKNISNYLKKIEQTLKRGDATEHTYRSALESLIESSADGITATNEPKRVKCGAPDLIVSRGQVPLGYIECKDIGKSLNRIEKSEQFRRYLDGLGNLILTDYLEFRWYVEGKRRMETARLAIVGSGDKLKRDEAGIELFQYMLSEFLKVQAPTVSTPKELAGRMAGIAKIIRDSIEKALTETGNGGKLEDILEGFKKVLLHNLTSDQFADMYAQTICYGLFAARCNFTGKTFSRIHAAYDLPKTNPFLRKIFTELAGPELDERITWAVDDLAELLNHADIGAILEDFGKRTRKEDPILHFYETFLAAYDPKMREARGVYYTPEPVVSYIVRSVDHIPKNDFGLKDGLADSSKVTVPKTVYVEREKDKDKNRFDEWHKVLILDPAVGTGTFLHGVIDHIHDHIVGMGQKGTWSGYVSEHLLPRIFGFELLMAPYTMAHMKLGIQLKEMRYNFRADERLGIYLTNTLEEAHEIDTGQLFARWLIEEANAAVKVKLDMPILVVLGNPPYSGHSANTGKWIKKLLRGKDTRTGDSTENYFEVDGHKLRERNPKWLNDDYVKFIRFAQWRIENTGYGILAFITNHGYIDNPTFRGMRQSLMETFDDIYILDLHGNSKKKEKCPDGSKDENVFDIQQGVAIGIFVKRKDAKKKAASVRHAHLWGVRNNKYHHLFETDVSTTEWEPLEPQSPFYLFIPQDTRLLAEYEIGWKITEAIIIYNTGLITARDRFVFGFTRDEVLLRVKDFVSNPLEEGRVKYGLKDTRERTLEKSYEELQLMEDLRVNIKDCLRRPFDIQSLFYHASLVRWPVHDIMHHMLAGENMGLIFMRQVALHDDYSHFGVTRHPVDNRAFYSNKGIMSLAPLYLYPSASKSGLFDDATPSDAAGGRRPNLSEKFIADFSKRLKLEFIPDGSGDLKKTFGPEDIFNYMYAVFHSPTYRTRYAEFLKIDFPRLPLTSSKKLFRELCAAGSELVELHLMETRGPSFTGYPISGDDVVEKVRYTEPGQGAKKGRVWINKTQYFEGVPKEVWEFHVGGYQVCQKWLKDRKGRKLEYADIKHYQGIVSALSETIRIMSEIDDVIETSNGWPIE